MDISKFLGDGQYILPDHPKLQYCGRIGRGNNGMPEFVYPCTFVKWRFKGRDASVILTSRRFYQDIYAGFIIDGHQYKMMLNAGADGHSRDGYATERVSLLKDGKADERLIPVEYERILYSDERLIAAEYSRAFRADGKNMSTGTDLFKENCRTDATGAEPSVEIGPGNTDSVDFSGGIHQESEGRSEQHETACRTNSDGSGLPENMEDIHEIVFFKRQDAMNVIEMGGIVLDTDAGLLECDPLPVLKMEVYGDSVSAGEVSEALDCVAAPDPEGHEGKYSNSWYSYSWMTARRLNARLHDIAQGGIALLDGTGWFSWPDFIGLESIYDKVRYYPELKNATHWDFSKYIPDIVVIAVGQNDANPLDYMKMIREREAAAGSNGTALSDLPGKAGDYEDADLKAQCWKEHYRDFVLRIRGLYKEALIICATTILNHDRAWDDVIEEVVAGLNDPKVKHFLYTGNGCGTPGHIRIPEAERMSEELAGFINSLL